MIENVSPQQNCYKKQGRNRQSESPCLWKRTFFQANRFGNAIHPSAQTYSLAMLGSMEPDPIAGFTHVTNIVIIPGGLRKCRALE